MNSPAAPIRVLLVEPHDDSRDLYELGLRAHGFDVFAVADAAAAMRACAHHPPTIVVSETRVRGWSDLLTSMVEKGMPIIALTTDPLFYHQSFRAGPRAVLLKPCFPDEVVAAIRGTLGFPR
jgi:DNA-binding response OmpR family regulator